MNLKYKKFVLKNGIRAITIPMKNTAAITSLILVRAGSHYESKKFSGIFHYVEHLVFKGSKKYPNAYELRTILDGLGGSYNAFTSTEQTGFYIKTTADNVEKGLDVMSDFLKNPLFSATEVKKEKGPIIEELRFRNDTPQTDVYRLFLEIFYGNQPAGQDTGGTEETIRNITQSDIKSHFDKFYNANNIIAIFAGDLSHAKGIELANKFFGDVVEGELAQKLPVLGTKPKGRKVSIKYQEAQQTSFVLGFNGLNIGDSGIYSLIILSDILGGGMSSRLFEEVRDKRGWAYAISADTIIGSDYGLFLIGGGLTNNKLKDALRVIIKELKKIKNSGITKEELTRTKDRLRTSILLGLETSNSVANYFGRQEVLENKLSSPENELLKIRKVTGSQVKKVANEIFTKDVIKLALIGPHKNKKELEKILNKI